MRNHSAPRFDLEIKNIINQGIKINIFGDLKKLNSDVKNSIKKSIYEDRKELRMNICNLCYDDLENDAINMMQSPKALYITP